MRRAVIIGGAGGALLLLIGLTLWFRTGPDRVEPGEVAPDAVAMFAGGRGERLDLALDFVASSPDAALVIPNGFDNRWPDANLLCSDPNSNVFCPTPEPDTTRGEAAAIAAVADEQGWNSMVIVTSDYHASRAWTLFSRCFDGVIGAGVADANLSFRNGLSRYVHEWFGHVDARLLTRDC